MSKKKEPNQIFINNLKYLMERAKEDKVDLAIDLDKDESTINNYLSGRRASIDDELLTRIAIHFKVTKKALLEVDLSKIMDSMDKKATIEDFFKVFPFPSVEIENVNINEAINRYIELSKGGKFNSDLETIGEKIYTTLNNIYKKTNNEDVLIWIVWYDLLSEFYNSLGIDNDDDEETMIRKAMVQYTYNGINYDTDEKFEESLYEKMSILRKGKWSDLTYYYIALRYLYGYGNSELNIEDNKKVGGSMMKELLMIDNDYAFDFFELYIDKYNIRGEESD